MQNGTYYYIINALTCSTLMLKQGEVEVIIITLTICFECKILMCKFDQQLR